MTPGQPGDAPHDPAQQPNRAVRRAPAPGDHRQLAQAQHDAGVEDQEHPDAGAEGRDLDRAQDRGPQGHAEQAAGQERPQPRHPNAAAQDRGRLDLADHRADHHQGRGQQRLDRVQPEAERHQTGAESGQARDEAGHERARADDQDKFHDGCV
jgi:hypothetical protein